MKGQEEEGEEMIEEVQVEDSQEPDQDRGREREEVESMRIGEEDVTSLHLIRDLRVLSIYDLKKLQVNYTPVL